MTVKGQKINGTFNGKQISDLTSEETTELVRALLEHRKTINAKGRTERQAAKAKRAEERLGKASERAAKAAARANATAEALKKLEELAAAA